MKTYFIVLILFFSLNNSFSQEIVEPKHTINVELGLPVSMANKSYKGIMQGVVNASAYYQYRMQNSFTMGIGGNLGLFSVNTFRVNPSVKGSIVTYGGFVKVGYEKFYTETFGLDFGVKFGYNQLLFKDSLLVDDYPKKEYTINALNMTPMLGLKLLADNANSYSFTFGYTFQDYNFFPGRLGYPNNGYSEKDMRGSTQFLTVGFAYTHYIGRKSEE